MGKNGNLRKNKDLPRFTLFVCSECKYLFIGRGSQRFKAFPA